MYRMETTRERVRRYSTNAAYLAMCGVAIYLLGAGVDHLHAPRWLKTVIGVVLLLVVTPGWKGPPRDPDADPLAY